jgi:hypothetical protein
MGSLTDIWLRTRVQSDDEPGQERALEGKATIHQDGRRY